MSETRKVYVWCIPTKVVEYRGVCVEATTKAEAMRKYRAADWVEGDDPDDTRTKFSKAGPIERRDEVEL